MDDLPARVILFDGVCNFCDGAVRFIIRRDPKCVFHFGALQSGVGQALLSKHGLPADDFDSMVLIEDGRIYQRSTAALRIAKRLRFPWPLLYVGVALPTLIRDPIYNWVARNRYRWLGRKEACMIPGPEIRDRFL